MNKKLIPVSLTILGYLICIGPLLYATFGGDFDVIDLKVCWSIGIPLHFIASAVYFFLEKNGWKRMIYLLIPIPLGFVLTLGAIAYAIKVWGMYP